MAGIAEGVAADISASIIKKAATQAQYVFSFNNFVETLGKEKQELMLKQRSIEGDAVKAHRRAEIIDAEVQKWLDDAQNLMKKVGKLQQEIHMHKAAWCCPNFIQRYRLCRRVAKKTEQLKDNCNFRVFARAATLQGMKYYSSEGFISFESRKRVHDQLMEALKDDGIHSIGVHGMGGCGKTTLVKEVGKEAEELGLFEKVLFVIVSNNPDIKKIQASIASSLDFKFETEENEPERARRLSTALSSMRRILVILDDVWEKLNFEDIGIPNNCYILLTTRELSVCNTMGCQEKVSLLLLNEEESWNLFQNCAGITEENFDTFEALGQEIANECNGLPVAIAAVAGSLKGKELVDWKDTRDKLRVSEPVDIEPGLPNPYKCLQVSYDNLVKSEFKLLFLLCSLFPEDEEIPEEWLARFAMGLGLFGKIHSNERTRNLVSVAINKLVGSCLLLNGDERNTIKMHDLVHDIALQIAKAENKIIIEKKISKKKLEENSILIDNQVRYLLLDMDEFPDQLNCSNLECLFIHTNSEYQVREPFNFFNGMKELKVLGLFNESHKCPFVQLSNSIESLTNLRSLWLDEWELGDMSFVGSLTTIEALILYNCSFHELPDSVVNLKNLRLMNLIECKIESNPYGVIQRCAQLEELYFVGNEYPEWEEKGENRVEFLGKLQRYQIEFGPSIEEFDYWDGSTKRYLSIEDVDTQFSTATADNLIRRAEVLSLGGIHRGCTSIIPAFVQKIGQGMNELAKFIVYNSDELECVVDMTKSFYQDGAVFSNLTHLEISELQKLESLFLGQPDHHIFQKLEELHISECNQLKHLIADEPREIVSDGDNPRSYNSVFPKLKLIAIDDCESLEYLMPVSFAEGLLQLEELEIEGCSQLKYAFGQSNYEVEDSSSNQNLNKPNPMKLQALKDLRLASLQKIVSICSESYYLVCPSMDSLKLENCPQLNIMVNELESRQSDHTITKNGIFCNLTKLSVVGLDCLETLFVGTLHLGGLEKLEEISIHNCNHLKHLIANDVEKITLYGKNSWSYNSVFPKLKKITIEDCEEIEYFMPISFATGLLQLEEVNTSRASQLRYVFGPSNHKAEDQFCNQNQNELHIIKLQALKKLRLSSLPNILSICPENYYPIWPSLDSLVLMECPPLNIIPIKNCIVASESREQQHTITKELGEAMLSNVQDLKSLSVSSYNEVDGIFHLQGFLMDGQQVTAGLIDLRLNSVRELKHIWSGPKQFLSLQNLQSLVIRYCGKLQVVFSISILRSLNQLKMLQIEECQELHQIFEVDEKNKDQSNPGSEQVWLPELTTLIVQQSNKLKCLFSFTTSIELPKLKFIIIKEASELEEVITCDEKGDKREQLQVKFPELEHVVLVQLPKLREVYRGVELQTVRHRLVYHCPKLSLKSSATLENLKETYKDYYYKALSYHEFTVIEEIRDTLGQAPSEMMEEESKSGSIEEKEQESDEENPKSKETVVAPLSVHLEQSNKGRVEESPTFDDVTLTHAKSTSSPQTADQPQLKEKEDHNEELGNDSKNKHHQKTSLAVELSTTMPEAQSGTVQSKEKSCNWGKFEESPLEKTTSHQIVPEKLDLEIGELVQNVPTNEPLSAAKDQALETIKVSSASQLSFFASVPLAIPIPSPTSQYFSNTSNAEGDHTLGDFDHNKQPKEYFEAIEQSSISGPLVLLQNPSPQSNRGRIEQVPTTDANLVTSTKANTTGSLLDLPQGQNRISQTKTNNREDPKVEPVINLQAFEGTDLVDLFQSMEEDDDVQASMPSTSVISANNPDMEVKSIAKALADLQISLKMPLENIACSEAESLRLENALNFLSSHSCADGAMSDGLKAAIDSLHQEFHNILSSFKQASATILRFTLLEEKEKTIKEELPRRKESAIALMNEIQQKEVSVMEQISKLQDELSSLQEQKKKCIADAIRFKSEFESVKNNKAQMLEDHVNSREELFKVDYIWSTLCSEFVDNLFSASNLP